MKNAKTNTYHFDPLGGATVIPQQESDGTGMVRHRFPLLCLLRYNSPERGANEAGFRPCGERRLPLQALCFARSRLAQSLQHPGQLPRPGVHMTAKSCSSVSTPSPRVYITRLIVKPCCCSSHSSRDRHLALPIPSTRNARPKNRG